MQSVFNDFSGGITDFPFNAASNFASICDNLLVNRDKSLEGRWGFEFLNSDAPRIPQGNKRINKCIEVNDTLVFSAQGNLSFINGNTFETILGPTNNKAFDNGDANSLIDVVKWGDHYFMTDTSQSTPIKVFKNQYGELKCLTSGLPKPSDSMTIIPSVNDGASYIYAFVFEYEYYVGTTKHLDLSEPQYVQLNTTCCDFNIAGRSIDFNSLPQVSNGAIYNWDETNIKLRIYRTIKNGTVPYLVASLVSGITSYQDTVSDAYAATQIPLYSISGIRPNTLPPRAKYITLANNVMWYGNVLDSAENKPYRLRFSLIGDPDSCPSDFYEDFEAEITGLESINDKVIVFTEDKVIRVEGTLDSNGRGVIIRNVIANLGCIQNNSIVKTSQGIYFWSDSGIYFTNGYEYEKLTNHLDKFYARITLPTKRKSINGAYDKVNQRVYWTYQENHADGDKILVFDEIYKGLITFSNGDNFLPTAIYFLNDNSWIRCDSDGYVFKHHKDVYDDLVRNYLLAPKDWHRTAIPFDYKHISWDFGDTQRQKWVTQIGITGNPETNVSIELRVYHEGSTDYKALKSIDFAPLISWADPSILWGEPQYKWLSLDFLNHRRKMINGMFRATHRQIGIALAYTTIQSSVEDINSHVTVDSVSKQVIINNPLLYSFGLGNEGFDIIINNIAYQIIQNTDDTLLLSDDDNTLISGNYPFVIKGYPKAQRPHISSFSINYELLGNADKYSVSANK